MHHPLEHTECPRLKAALAVARMTYASGRTRSSKILQFKHYCTDAPI